MNKEFEWTGHAMGTDYAVALVCPSEAGAQALFTVAKAEIESYEARFSRFLVDSELSILNRSKDLVVSKTFFDATEKAYELYIKTKGYFNPLVQIARFGYSENFTNMDKEKNIEAPQPYNTDFTAVVRDPRTCRIQLLDDQMLDYGGFLKGYAAQKITEHLRTLGPECTGIVVNIGGDISTWGSDELGNPFEFSIYNPVTDHYSAVTLHNQSLATSGIYKRTWKNSGQMIHHILDQTGLKNPPTTLISVSVIHHDGAVAEGYTKMFLSLDEAEARSVAIKEKIGFISISASGKITKYMP